MNEPKQTITALELFDSSEVGINPKGYFDYSFTPEKLDMIRSYLAALYRMTDEADPHEALDDTGLDIVERLRGKVRVPITDGLGPVEEGGSADFFERTFPNSKLAKEAAAYIENIRAALTAQQPDVPRYDPRLGLIQKDPVNQELLEANNRLVEENRKLKAGLQPWQTIETAPEGKNVLVCYEKRIIEIAWRYGDEWKIDTKKMLYNPTHWMPIPKPPTEKNDE